MESSRVLYCYPRMHCVVYDSRLPIFKLLKEKVNRLSVHNMQPRTRGIRNKKKCMLCGRFFEGVGRICPDCLKPRSRTDPTTLKSS